MLHSNLLAFFFSSLLGHLAESSIISDPLSAFNVQLYKLNIPICLLSDPLLPIPPPFNQTIHHDSFHDFSTPLKREMKWKEILRRGFSEISRTGKKGGVCFDSKNGGGVTKRCLALSPDLRCISTSFPNGVPLHSLAGKISDFLSGDILKLTVYMLFDFFLEKTQPA